MPVPQPILDALTQLSGDADTLASDVISQTAAASDLAAAQHAKDVADSTVVSDVSKLTSDKAALIALIDSTFPGSPPVPPPSPVPAPVG